ncbi:MAG: hypothetical protein KDA57_16470 [Planctomycetales bacterium]|nr:hypothetical protein [Planctomycetales bacterium]
MSFIFALIETAQSDSDDWWQSVRNWIRETLGPPLKSLHEPIDNWLASLPMWVAVACAIGLFVIAGLWVWTLRTEFIFRDAPDRHWWRDLRLWAMVVLAPYITIYLFLGR